MQATAEKIKTDILEHLEWDLRVDPKDINVEVMQGNVRLSGSVRYMTGRLVAQMIAYTVSAVMSVKNDLEVQYMGEVSRDDDIQARIQSVLQWNTDIDQSHIAESLILNIAGVRDIRNELIVVPVEGIADKLIAGTISAALDRNAYISNYLDSVYINVKDGKVTVSGNVPDYAVHREIMSVISYAAGVVDVIDDLRIGQ
ncbi:MAG: BON domain-containing protein [Nitrospirota bacterium]